MTQSLGVPARHQENIAEMVDGIARSDSAIPVFDEGLVHLLHVPEGTLTEANDINMVEVMVGGEPEVFVRSDSHGQFRDMLSNQTAKSSHISLNKSGKIVRFRYAKIGQWT